MNPKGPRNLFRSRGCRRSLGEERVHPQDCGAGPKDQMRYPMRSGRCHPVSARMESPSPFPARLAIADPGRSRFCRSRPKIREKDRAHRPTKPCFPRRKSREILRTIVQRGPMMRTMRTILKIRDRPHLSLATQMH